MLHGFQPEVETPRRQAPVRSSRRSRSARAFIVTVIDGLLSALDAGALTAESFSAVWEGLVDAGVCEVARVDSADASGLHVAYTEGQQDLDADPAYVVEEAAAAVRADPAR